MQYPVIAFILAIVACITEAMNIYCLDSDDKHFAYFWVRFWNPPTQSFLSDSSQVNIISIISVALAIGAIIQFYRNVNSYIKKHKAMVKLMAFKSIVGLVFLEKVCFTSFPTQGTRRGLTVNQILFTILDSTDTLNPSATMSYADVHIGLPTMIICIQMVPFAFFFHYAYSTKPYHILSTTHVAESQQYLAVYPTATDSAIVCKKQYQGGPFGLYAWCAFANPLEILREIKSTWDMMYNARAEPMSVHM